MADHLQKQTAKSLGIDFSTLAVWLPSINDNAMPLLRRIQASRADILASRAGGRLACRYSVLTDGGHYLLKIETIRAGKEISHGSVMMCCETGRVFRTYTLDTENGGKREERLYFHGLEDATRYLIFASRMEVEAETREKARQFRRDLPAIFSKSIAAAAA